MMEERRVGMLDLTRAVGELQGEMKGLRQALEHTHQSVDKLNSRLEKVEKVSWKWRGAFAVILFIMTVGIPAAVAWLLSGDNLIK